MSNLMDKFKLLNGEFQDFMGAPSAGGSWKLSLMFQEMDNTLREHIQATTQEDVNRIISKLMANMSLDQNDRDFLRLWIVGDADFYVRLEDDYQEWLNEMQRIMSDVNKAGDPFGNYVVAASQRAYLMDGIRVLGDIMFFLKQKERIANFVESTREIDPEEKAFLIDILRGKITSPKA